MQVHGVITFFVKDIEVWLWYALKRKNNMEDSL